MQRTPPSATSQLRRLYGLVSFEEPIICSREVLGAIAAVSIGGVAGHLAFPSLPDWTTPPADPLHMPLVPPIDALTWKQGDELLVWGRPAIYPTGISWVEKVLLHFDVTESELPSAATTVHRAFDRWRSLFVDYLELLTKQRKVQHLRITNRTGDLSLFCWNAEHKAERPYEKQPIRLVTISIAPDSALTVAQLEQVCGLASADTDLALEYRIQLEAYRALRAGDFRKAIIETAVAAEVVLTSAIRAKLRGDGITYAEKLLSKFRMLGGRLELAQTIQIPLPCINLSADLVEPRNNVIHRAEFADEQVAHRAISATDEIIRLQPSALY
jgi:hypothetical protein